MVFWRLPTPACIRSASVGSSRLHYRSHVNTGLLPESDCGVRMFLSDQPIIVDRMPAPVEGDSFADKPVPIVPTKEKSGILKTESPMVELVGGQKYKIRVEMVHSNHLKYANSNSATIRYRVGALRKGVSVLQPFLSLDCCGEAELTGNRSCPPVAISQATRGRLSSSPGTKQTTIYTTRSSEIKIPGWIRTTLSWARW